jgi:hypothetical protein
MTTAALTKKLIRLWILAETKSKKALSISLPSPEEFVWESKVKKYRTWLYPRSTEVKEILGKCGDIDAVPVFMARRLPFLTIRLLHLGGCFRRVLARKQAPSIDISFRCAKS